MVLKRENEAHKSFVSFRNMRLSVACSKILTTPKLNFVNRLGIKLLPGENKEEKKGGGKKRPLPCSDTHTNAHTYDVHALLHLIRTCVTGLLHDELQNLLLLTTG